MIEAFQSWLTRFTWWRYNRLVRRTMREEMRWALGKRPDRPPPLPPPPEIPGLGTAKPADPTLEFFEPYLLESSADDPLSQALTGPRFYAWPQYCPACGTPAPAFSKKRATRPCKQCKSLLRARLHRLRSDPPADPSEWPGYCPNCGAASGEHPQADKITRCASCENRLN